jgi:hypothetical protein
MTESSPKSCVNSPGIRTGFITSFLVRVIYGMEHFQLHKRGESIGKTLETIRLLAREKGETKKTLSEITSTIERQRAGYYVNVGGANER